MIYWSVSRTGQNVEVDLYSSWEYWVLYHTSYLSLSRPHTVIIDERLNVTYLLEIPFLPNSLSFSDYLKLLLPFHTRDHSFYYLGLFLLRIAGGRWNLHSNHPLFFLLLLHPIIIIINLPFNFLLFDLCQKWMNCQIKRQ